MFQVVLKQYFEGYQGGQLKVLDAEMFRTGEGHSAIVTLDNPSGTSCSHTYIPSPFYKFGNCSTTVYGILYCF